MADLEKAIQAVSDQFARFLAIGPVDTSHINFAEREAEREAKRHFPDLASPFTSKGNIDHKILHELVRVATMGDLKADACLRVTAALFLEYGHRFPELLARYTAGALCAGIPRPRNHWMKNEGRDIHIAICVKTVHLMGFSPTRNASLHGRDDRLSACAVVARVLKEFNVPISEKGVEKIWNNLASIREFLPPDDLPSYDTKRI